MPGTSSNSIGADFGASMGLATDRVMARSANLGMTERQAMLDHYYRYYRCLRYESRTVGWDGSDRASGWHAEQMYSQRYVPTSGAPDTGMPMRGRYPVVQYNLVRLIVNRLTGLLFSARQTPHIRVAGDAQTEDWLQGFAEDADLWAQMSQARTLGGAMGSVVLGVQFVRGAPVVEVFDPRHAMPEFEDLETRRVLSLEVRYQYPRESRDAKGRPTEEMWWYRRIINEQSDVVYEPAPVGDGDEPLWSVRSEVRHGLDFCPVVWVQNTDVPQSVDGDPDCDGVWDELDAIDYLTSDAVTAVAANCDPTLIVSTIKESAGIRKGSANAIALNPGDSANYLELAGTGPKAALETAELLRARALEIAQVVLEHADVANRTATEIERLYESMYAKADQLRHQYGRRALVPLLEMAVEMARRVARPRLRAVAADEEAAAPSYVQGQVRISPRYETDQRTGAVTEKPRIIGRGGKVSIAWPSYDRPSAQDTDAAVRAAAGAVMARVIDRDTAARYVAPRFGVEDVAGMLKRLHDDETNRAAEDDQALMGALQERSAP